MLGPDVVGRRPELYLAAARVAELNDAGQRRAWLDAAVAAAKQNGVDAVARAAEAELAREAVRHGDLDRAHDLARSVLAAARPNEVATRGRALAALGHLATVRATPEALREAERHLEEAATLFHLAGEREWESDALLRLGYAVSYHGGRFERAVEQLSEALALLPAADRARGNALTYVVEVLRTVGRFQEADAAAREALAIGQRIGDSWVVAAACWAAMGSAAANGDLEGIQRWIAGAERSPGPWVDTGAGFEFLLEAGDHLAANGDPDGARAFHDRATARADAADGLDLHHALAHLTFRIEATYGDPARAAELFDAIDGGAWAVQRNRWVRRMLRALAAQRAGDGDAAVRFAADGWRELELLGDTSLFERTEPALHRTLAALTPTDRPTGLTVESPPRPGPIVTLLGGFGVWSSGADATPAPGHPSTVVKLLALRGATPVEEVIELLWPDADATAGRSRLRNLLNRLRERSGPLVERRGEQLVLAVDAAVDASRFEQAATVVAAADPAERVGLARAAVSLYVGELLPGDRHLDWLAAPRERLRRRYLGLVDLVADDALARNDLDEALDLLELGLAAEPYDEERYVKSARALLAQGRRNAAADVVRRGLAAVDELGVEPTDALAALAGETGTSTR
jgi:DNA-binding SARP family transcriptional activator